MSIDIRLLIKHVEERPSLWDREDKHYCHKIMISKLWAEIALIHGVPESKLKAKWKGLRDTFRTKVKKNHQSLWQYYQNMEFLKGQLKGLPTRKKPDLNEDLDSTINIKTEPEEERQRQSEEEDSRCGSINVEGEGEQQQTMTDIGEGDYHFLMSLLPEMRRLEPHKKLLLKIKIMKLFYNTIY